jgi:lipopolysaccharide assembly LptE-like protein
MPWRSYTTFWISAVVAAATMAAGCTGYQVGNWSLYDRDVRTVYVPMFESASYRRNLGERLTEAVMKEIEAKTPYKVVGSPNADSILSGRIVGETKRVVAENVYDDPRELDVDLQVEVSWIDRRGSAIRAAACVELPPELSMVHGNTSLVPEVGQSVATAHQLAIGRVAERIVAMMETPW